MPSAIRRMHQYQPVLLLRFFLRLYNLFLSKDKSLAKRVRQMTGFVPARLSIFKLAFSHKSNQATKDYAQTNNERLEYLGDAVLGTIVAEYLFKKYPNGDEGFLTKMRSKIVKRKSLNHIGDQMGLDVLLSEYNRTRLSSSMLGNAVEALVGAVYLEKGYRGTKRFVIQRMLKLYVDMHELETVDDNYKSQLLEYCQKNGTQVSYKLLNKFKQDRRDRFKVAVMVNGEQISLADDFNKKSAEQLASLRALQKLGLIDKGAPSATGRKSPSKDTFSTAEKKTKKARPDRKPRKAPQRVAKEKVVSDEQLAVSAISKQQTTKPKTPRAENGKPSEIKPRAKAREKAQAPKRKASGAVLPPKKQRRNNSRLGRTIWNGIQTAGTSIEIVDGMGYFEKLAGALKTKPAPKRRKTTTSTEKRTGLQPSAPQAGKKTVTPKQAATSANGVASKKSSPKEPKPASTRKRRPIPLRLLTPIVKDASAVMAIDFTELFGIVDAQRPAARPQTKKVARKPKRKPALKKEKVESLAQKPSKSSWEDTPLGLSSEAASVPMQRPARNAKADVKKEEKVNAEQLDKWEDTLLEITSESNEPTSNLPKMYKKSDANARNSRRRPQRRSTNRKKKTEE